MRLEKIVTLANCRVRLRFLAMERSLRANGCALPLLVLPYDDTRFALPPNASWCEAPALFAELAREKAHPTMRKYACLTMANYQFVDSDVIFLRNVEATLASHSGFITSCCHWHNPAHTYTDESLAIFRARSTTWQREVFNTGQFACDDALYQESKLLETIRRPEAIETCLRFRFHEQPGLNLLVHLSRHPVTNLTLPPTLMESTWAGDYGNEYESYWTTEERKPYLIHWAGCRMDSSRAIDELFVDYLSAEERREWQEDLRARNHALSSPSRRIRSAMRRFVRTCRSLAGDRQE